MKVYGRERKETGCEEKKGSHTMGPNNFHKIQTITAHGGLADRAVAAAFWHLQPASGSRSQCAADGHDGHGLRHVPRAGQSGPCPGSEPAGSSFFFQAEDGIRDYKVTGVQTCALPI